MGANVVANCSQCCSPKEMLIFVKWGGLALTNWTSLDTANSNRYSQQLEEEVGAELPVHIEVDPEQTVGQLKLQLLQLLELTYKSTETMSTHQCNIRHQDRMLEDSKSLAEEQLMEHHTIRFTPCPDPV